MIVEVAAGVIDGNMVTERVCMTPSSARRRITGSRPVVMAGQTTCGVAASMTTSRAFDATASVYTSGTFRRAATLPHQGRHRTVHTPRADPTDATDDALMRDLRAGGDSGSVLFARYRDPVWRFFRRRLRDAGRAEELAQDVFTALLEAAPRYEPRAPFRSYLFGIAYNVLMAHRRKTGLGTVPIEADVAAEPRDPDDSLWVRRALERLDPADREVLMLREYEQLSYQEIADLQQIPVNTVRSRLFRARIALKNALLPASEEQR